jgi:hypothetical protein
VKPGLSAAGKLDLSSPTQLGATDVATVRRYETIDASHKDELTKKVGESLAPRLSGLPAFSGYFVIDTGARAMETVAAKVVGPRDGQAGFLGTIGVRGPGDGWGGRRGLGRS